MKPAGIALFVVGVLVGGAGLVWGRVGYYGSQAPILFTLLAIGATLMFIGSRMHRDKDPNKAVAWRPADPSPDGAATGSVPFQASPPPPPPPPPTAPMSPSASAPSIPSEPLPELEESTRVVTRRSTTTWVLGMPGGATVPILRSALIGREPANRAEETHSLIRLTDPDPSVSKTHALIEVDESGLRVTDLGSTNGTVVIDPIGNETPCVPDEPMSVVAGGSIEFGTYPVYVTQGGSR